MFWPFLLFFRLVACISTLRLSLPLSNILSSHDVDHLGLQPLSSAVLETHVVLGDGVDLGLVTLLVDEGDAGAHHLVGDVTATLWVAVELLCSGLVGIQDQHQLLRLDCLPDEGE